jgi:DNA polymerase-3 subunit gamma/tau
MSYLVLARKWRPRGFEDLIGQESIVKVLTNAISQGKMAHAYVFSGPRGVGKTSTARILAKSLNCVEGPTPAPCGECDFCTGITEGSSVDVMEIDGASNNSVDDIRDLRERVKYAPSGGRYKIYIIDEAHMLSTPAFNALLKTLEEPPPHVVFVLATTEARKIPLTVMSRCQHLPFRRVASQAIKDRLRHIVGAEEIKISESALGQIARAADGSMRDSLTILDQLASFSAEIEESDVLGLLDRSDFGTLALTASSVIEGDREGILKAVAALVERGSDLRVFTRDLIGFFRDLLVSRAVTDAGKVLDIGEEEMAFLRETAPKVSDAQLSLILAEIMKMEAEVRSAFSPRVALEMALLRLSYLSTFRPVDEAIAALSGMTSFEEAPRAEKESRPAPPSPSPDKHGGAANPKEDVPAPSSPAGEAEAHTGKSLLQGIIDNLEDPRLAARLAKAEADLKGERLVLNFGDADAAICAKPFKDNPEAVESLAAQLRGAPTKIEIHIVENGPATVSAVKERALSEPVVKEALDLFEGRVVNVKPTEDNP